MSAFDILAGIAILFPDFSPYTYLLFIIFYLAIFHIIKGGLSIITALSVGFMYDIAGIIDILTGVVMFAMYSGINYSFFWIIGTLVLIKGIWSFIASLS